MHKQLDKNNNSNSKSITGRKQVHILYNNSDIMWTLFKTITLRKTCSIDFNKLISTNFNLEGKDEVSLVGLMTELPEPLISKLICRKHITV